MCTKKHYFFFDKESELCSKIIFNNFILLIMDENYFLDAAETAQLLRTSVGYVRKMCHERRIPFYKLQRKVLFRREELVSLIEDGRVATTSELAEQADTNAMRRLMRRKEVVS